MDYLMLVNKEKPLDKNFLPKNLVKVKIKTGGNKLIYLEKKTYKQIKKLLKDINKIFDVLVVIDSGYRTYLYQENLMKELLKEKGMDAYNSLAKPGYSEHHTGLAVDLGFYKNNEYISNFKENDFKKEFEWIENNAYKYGFILRYPLNKENITGYIYEPWHLRFVGDIAEMLYKLDLTLEEYYEIFI